MSALAVLRNFEACIGGDGHFKLDEAMLENIFKSLQFFLEGAENESRVYAARLCLSLRGKLGPDMTEKYDLSTARRVLDDIRSRREGYQDASELSTEDVEIEAMLSGVFQEAADKRMRQTSGGTLANFRKGEDDDGSPNKASGDLIIECRCKEASQIDESILDSGSRQSIQQAVVKVAGVVSAVFDGAYIVIHTRTRSIASDKFFQADIIATVESIWRQPSLPPLTWTAKACNVHFGYGSTSFVLEKQANYAASECTGVQYLDDDADEDSSSPVVIAQSLDQLPAKEDTGPDSRSASKRGTHFTFVRAGSTSHKIREYDDDPSVAARLRKSREARRNQGQSRFGRLLSAFSWAS
eukprot:TRINITY_DN102729_c0_g1_i1.p1 TRINITY_DN102729_c0_g1~~TRINITY_DN102729_c0_g1_i1.p1  ORF type:complete len:354 (+),score=71.41 TRINITY_DN102729_c0_g1_i1:179-1240(+)